MLFRGIVLNYVVYFTMEFLFSSFYLSFFLLSLSILLPTMIQAASRQNSSFVVRRSLSEILSDVL